MTVQIFSTPKKTVGQIKYHTTQNCRTYKGIPGPEGVQSDPWPLLPTLSIASVEHWLGVYF